MAHDHRVQFEPGLDRHEWESQLGFARGRPARFAERIAAPSWPTSCEQMLEERGYDLGDPVAREGDEREVVAEYQAARELADRVDRDEDVDPGDVADAINGLLRSSSQHVDSPSATR